MEKQCLLCGRNFRPSDRARRQELCPSCRQRILDERDAYEAEWEQGGSPSPDFCVVCGKQIDVPRARKYTCSPDCKRKMRNVIEARTKGQKRADKQKRRAALKTIEKAKPLHPDVKKKTSHLTECIAAARKAGMTYGQYMGTKYSRST